VNCTIRDTLPKDILLYSRTCSQTGKNAGKFENSVIMEINLYFETVNYWALILFSKQRDLLLNNFRRLEISLWCHQLILLYSIKAKSNLKGLKYKISMLFVLQFYLSTSETPYFVNKKQRNAEHSIYSLIHLINVWLTLISSVHFHAGKNLNTE